ncbi:MAG TPA: metallophosphoesterase [Actinomycetota bacterium]|nr:metallophosphoesterase [Actinomycetota bacterium]
MKKIRAGLICVTLLTAIVLTTTASANHTATHCVADAYHAQSLAGPVATNTALPANSELLMRFVNVSDTHIIDDEASTAMNGTWLESLLEPAIGNGAAQRLQEEYSDEVLNALVKTINGCKQQLQDLELMIATGDLTDNMTLNELRRYIDNLDGVTGADTAFEANCGYKTKDSLGRSKGGLPCTPELQQAAALMTGKLVPDSQTTPPDVTGTAGTAYQLTPTRSALQIANTTLASEIGLSHNIAPGLPPRLRCNPEVQLNCDNLKLAIPHYAVFGNHDGSVRGTLTMQRPFQAGAAHFGRYFIENQREFINEWFKTESLPGPVGHGFEYVDASRWTDQNDRNDGYYAFDAGANSSVRMIVLNTIFDGVRQELHRDGQTATDTQGLVGGNEVTPAPATSEQGFVDQTQFNWLQGQLAAAQTANQAILVFGHHPDRSFSYAEYGSKLPQQFDTLLGTYPNVVAYIAGHTHENVIRPCTPTDCLVKGIQPTIANSFWRIETSSMIDFPQESRIIEVYRLPGGEFAIRSTMIQADQSDADASLSHRLAVAEAECKTSHLLGGPLSSGPYDQQRLQATLARAGEAAQRSNFCIQGIDMSAGQPKDRDTLLLP